MGHRTNGLPFLRIAPDQFVVDNQLKRIHHHTLTPYSAAEGLRLLKQRWHIHDPKGVYLTAFDQYMTLSYTGILIPPPSTVKSQEDTVEADKTQNSASPGQDHGVAVMITQPQPIPNAAQSSHIPTAKPRFGGYQDRFVAGQIGHNHSKRVTFPDKPPRRRSPAIAPSPSPSPVDGNMLSNASVVTENETLNYLSKSASRRLESEVHNSKSARI
jgi:hypothetical protein